MFFSCPMTVSSPVMLTSVCSLKFTKDDVGTSQSFHIYPRIDYKIQQSLNSSVSLVASLYEDLTMETSGHLATVSMKNIDRDTTGFCAVMMEPQITTFDAL